MTNKISYKSYPDGKEFSELYSKCTQQELANFYGCNKLRIRKWIDHFGLVRRVQGGGNNRKYVIDVEVLRNLVETHHSNSDIMSILKINSLSSLNMWLKKYNIKRHYDKTALDKYSRKVRYLTELEYSKYHKEINPRGLPRTLCGTEYGYQLDHIISITRSFYLGISCEKCASKDNLQMLTWKDNLNKRSFHKNNKDNK